MAKKSDIYIKHLEFLQNIITRMAENSFKVKTWAIVVTSAILSYLISNKSEYLCLAIIPLAFFWLLDSYYLWLEKCFVEKFKKVVKLKPPSYKEFDLDIEAQKQGKSFCCAMLSPASVLYPIVILSIYIVS